MYISWPAKVLKKQFGAVSLSMPFYHLMTMINSKWFPIFRTICDLYAIFLSKKSWQVKRPFGQGPSRHISGHKATPVLPQHAQDNLSPSTAHLHLLEERHEEPHWVGKELQCIANTSGKNLEGSLPVLSHGHLPKPLCIVDDAPFIHPPPQ